MTPKHPPGPPMTLGNMREHRVHHLVAYCPIPLVTECSLADGLIQCTAPRSSRHRNRPLTKI
jgi:hypothetical protein